MTLAAKRQSQLLRGCLALVGVGVAALGLAGCGGNKETDFDTFVQRHRCEKLVRGGDGDIDMSCVDPQSGKRVDIEFEANDRPGQYFTDTSFGGTVHVFGRDEVRDSQIYSKIKKS